MQHVRWQFVGSFRRDSGLLVLSSYDSAYDRGVHYGREGPLCSMLLGHA